MTFYRAKIQIIKIIDDYQGIFSSEIARRFGITRAVVHKILLKLEKRELIEKQQDNTDKKMTAEVKYIPSLQPSSAVSFKS